jgi:glycosyltransferase involved in cell wall biosynthesis
MPTALMEAMASGSAVVASDISGTNELVTDQSLGRLVPPQNPSALATSILEVLRDPKLRASMASRAREKVLAEFTIEVSMTRTEEVLEAVLNHQRLPSPLA